MTTAAKHKRHLIPEEEYGGASGACGSGGLAARGAAIGFGLPDRSELSAQTAQPRDHVVGRGDRIILCSAHTASARPAAVVRWIW
jgi:hypothetical protein